jgi:hypothetical protein
LQRPRRPRLNFTDGAEMKPLTWVMALAVALVTICFAVLSAQA